jgi:hypothetical protein
LCDGLIAELNAHRAARMPPCGRFGTCAGQKEPAHGDRCPGLEEAFCARLANFAAPSEGGIETPERTTKSLPLSVPARDEVSASSAPPIGWPRRPPRKPKFRSRSQGIDKTVLALPEPRLVQDRGHVHYIAKNPCPICGRQPCDAHHLRFSQSRALGRKVSDEFTVPLCRGHPREVHLCGDESVWWLKAGVDPTIAARALWLETHPVVTD